MTDKLYDALEICLHALEKGETLDSALARHPALADELRPLLQASLHARTLAGQPVSDAIQRRGRAKLLQRAAELREAKRAPRKRAWLFTFRPVAATFILALFLLTGTGLVRASNGALPGDDLYPVKRTWEEVTFLFIAKEDHDTLELAYETERVEEINELLAKGRTETVSFSGYVNSQADGQWTVAGVPVRVTNETNLPSLPITVGAAVMVTGRTDAQGFLVAASIETVAPGSIVPEIEDDDEHENEGGEEGGQNENSNGNAGEGGFGSSLGGEAEDGQGKPTNDAKSKLEGKIENMTGSVWTVDGKRVDVSAAEIVGQPIPGASVIIEGYYNADGTFIATRVTFVGGDSGESNGNDANANDAGGNDNGDDGNDNGDDGNDNGDDGNDNGGGDDGNNND
jgi:hypothetical protein